MSRKERRAPRVERVRALLEAGDHGGARAEARSIVADGAAGAEERAAAAVLLASLAPERGAVAAGALGVAAAVALSVALLVGG